MTQLPRLPIWNNNNTTSKHCWEDYIDKTCKVPGTTLHVGYYWCYYTKYPLTINMKRNVCMNNYWFLFQHIFIVSEAAMAIENTGEQNRSSPEVRGTYWPGNNFKIHIHIYSMANKMWKKATQCWFTHPFIIILQNYFKDQLYVTSRR